MKLTEVQIKWLKKATAYDLNKYIFRSEKYNTKEKMEIQDKWLEIHNRKLSVEYWAEPENWKPDEDKRKKLI